MGANGKYKVGVPGSGFALFTDSGKLAMDTAMMFRSLGHLADAWEKDHSGWEMISRRETET